MTMTITTPNPESIPAHVLPYWPFSVLDVYQHLALDGDRYAKALTHVTNPADVLRADSDYGASLWRDLMLSYYELALAPFTAVMNAASQASPPAAPKTPGRAA